MKIGILTYHRSHNYGALLQAVALRVYLEKLGHSVYYVDYWPDYHEKMYRHFDIYRFNIRGLKGKVGYLYHVIRDYLPKEKRIKTFNTFINNYIKPYCIAYSDDTQLDAVIYGSDQIWRRQKRLDDKFDEVYFGKNKINAKYQISYAASMGEIKSSIEDDKKIKESLSKFKNVGVREENLRRYLTEIGVDNILLNVDPTLLLNKDNWVDIVNIKPIVDSKYVLLYDLHPKSFTKELLFGYCEKRNLKLITLEGDAKRKTKNVFSTEGPNAMLSLIKYAEAVFTSSYHGLVFSIIFHKEVFATFKENAGRAQTLLKSLGLENRLLEYGVNEVFCEEIDYNLIDKTIRDLSTGSKLYLESL